jgi:cytochrome c553
MKIFFYMMAAMIVLGCMSSDVFAAGDAKKGKALFSDPKAFGGARACSACHPGGSGLENAAGKKVFHVAGGTQQTLEEAVNACIVNAGGGKAIDVNSGQMKDIVAYIKSLKKK